MTVKTPTASENYYRSQLAIAEATVAHALEAWDRLDSMSPSVSWERDGIAERVFLALSFGQELAAAQADGYTDAVLAEQSVAVDPEGEVIPTSLAGVASDGRALETLILQPVVTTAVAASRGMTMPEALSAGRAALTTIAATQVHDAGRAAVGMSIATRPEVGWIRMLEPGACSRCAILAGRFYRWSRGFERHENCRCKHIPATEDTANDWRTEPMSYFHSLSKEQQEKVFTQAGAQAIRDGADISQIVNARRGARGLAPAGRLTAAERKLLRGGREIGHLDRVDVYGRKVYITTEGTTNRGLAGRALIERTGSAQERAGTAYRISSRGRVKRDVSRTRARAPRLMPESIYEIANGRADAIRLLRYYGYIT